MTEKRCMEILRNWNHDVVESVDGQVYETWTVCYLPWTRPDLAGKTIREVIESNENTICVLDVRIRVYKELGQKIERMENRE